MKAKELAVKFNGGEFFMKIVEGGLISLTDVWRGQGMGEGKKPDNWLHTVETAEFLVTCLKSSAGSLFAERPDTDRHGKMEIRRWAKTIINECEKQGLIKITKGRKGGTFALRDVALAYAGYLSPELRNVIGKVFIERLEETVDPVLGLRRSRNRAVISWKAMGHDEPWIDLRIDGIDQRNEFTTTLGEHGVDNRGYPLCTNAIYTKLLHGSAKEIRKARNIPDRMNLRDSFDKIELECVKLSEMLAKRNIQAADAFGTHECVAESARAGAAVGVALQMAEAQPTRRIGLERARAAQVKPDDLFARAAANYPD